MLVVCRGCCGDVDLGGVAKASEHSEFPNEFDNPTVDNKHRTFSSEVKLISLATPLSRTVKCTFIPSFWHSCRNGSLLCSPPLSNWSSLIFPPICFSIIIFYFTNKSRTSFLCLMVYTQRHLDRSSTKKTKYR